MVPAERVLPEALYPTRRTPVGFTPTAPMPSFSEAVAYLRTGLSTGIAGTWLEGRTANWLNPEWWADELINNK